MRTYSLYIIRNTKTKKVYIGQTSTSVKERFSQHMKPCTRKQRGTYKIYNAMKKYGKNNFYVETLMTGISEEDIDRLEREYIEKYDSYKNGYNSTPGGDGKTIAKIDDVDTFTYLYNCGMPLRDIAKWFGVCKATVERTAEALGLPKRVMKVTEEYLLENMDKKTNIEMAAELGVNNYTITRAFRRYGIKRGKGCNNHNSHQNQCRLTEESKEEFARMWADRNIPIPEIAERFNINVHTVHEYRKRWGLPVRRHIKKSA